MSATDPRVDEYIERSKDFAKPILKHLREHPRQAFGDSLDAVDLVMHETSEQQSMPRRGRRFRRS